MIKSALLLNLYVQFLRRIEFASLFGPLANFRPLKAKGVHFDKKAYETLFSVTQGERVHHFSNAIRGFKLYRLGLHNRGLDLAQSYCIDRVKLRTADVVIDCGANYGDLWLYLEGKICPENYIAIEPNPSDFRALKANVGSPSVTLPIALGEADGLSEFYVSSESADSSLIEPSKWETIVTVTVRSLDSIVQGLGLRGIRLLKLEAEGFEPEILRGAVRALEITDFVALDGGPERGITKESTMEAAANFLLSHNFAFVDIQFARRRALFRRTYSNDERDDGNSR